MKFLLLFLIQLLLSFADYAQVPSAPKTHEAADSQIHKRADTMNTGEFWKIIDHSLIHSQGNNKLQKQWLVKVLYDYTIEQISQYEIIFRKYLIEADNFNVLAVPKIIEGLVSDDSYLYFRCWLISQGEKIFKATLINPDYLADKLTRTSNIYFEDFMSVATEAYILKTGIERENANFPSSIALSQGLDYNFPSTPTKGKKWQASQLPYLYPELWKKFR